MVKLQYIQPLKNWLIMFMLATFFALGVNQFCIALSVVNGTSMQPTLHNGDRLLINRFKFLIDQPAVGEVITFRDPSNSDRYLVKRVIGAPGDKIEIRDGVLFRNGHAIKEKYIDSRIQDGNFGPIVVRPYTVFVMGDNRHRYASRDSRYDSVGLVPFKLIDGKVEFILWRPSLEDGL